jgi:type I restriction enzyme, S subunit
MTATLPSLAKLKPNSEWASVPLFDRTGWQRVRFDDVVENCNESCEPAEAGLERFIAMEHLDAGSLHVRSWGNVADGTTFTRRCRPGQVLFGKRRAYQRKVAVAEFEAVVSGDIYVLAPKDTKRLIPELLPLLCLSERFFQHAVGTSAGSLSPRTNWSSLASFDFDLPPLDQQRRIAEILWSVDSVLRAHQKTHDSLVEVFQTELRKVYFGRIGHGGIESFQMEALPDEWRVVTVAEIARVIRGSSPRPKSDSRYYGGTIPRVMVADITRDKKHILPCIDFLTEEGSKRSRPVTRGTLILVCSGTPQQVGLPGILAIDACIHDGIIGLVDIANDCRVEWLFHLFRFSQSFMDSAATHGGTFVNLTTDIVKGIQFGLPSLAVQDACIARFGKLELGIASCESSIESDRKLLQALLNSIS